MSAAVRAYQNELKQGRLVQSSAKVLVPRNDVICAAVILLRVARRRRELVVVLAILFHLFHDLEADVLKGNGRTLSISQIYTIYRVKQGGR